MKKMMARTEEELDRVANELVDEIEKGGSRFRGMTYEEGADAVLQWVRGHNDDDPYPED